MSLVRFPIRTKTFATSSFNLDPTDAVIFSMGTRLRTVSLLMSERLSGPNAACPDQDMKQEVPGNNRKKFNLMSFFKEVKMAPLS